MIPIPFVTAAATRPASGFNSSSTGPIAPAACVGKRVAGRALRLRLRRKQGFAECQRGGVCPGHSRREDKQKRGRTGRSGPPWASEVGPPFMS